MSYPVPLSYSPIGEHPNFPWIRPSQMLKTMSSNGDFHYLLGGLPTMAVAKKVLNEFWERFEKIYPFHGIFRKIRESDGRISASQILPLIVHGDEGTTYKKQGMLVIQFSGAFGYGTSKSKGQEGWYLDLKSSGIPLNLVKTAMQTRFLSFVCPKDRSL